MSFHLPSNLRDIQNQPAHKGSLRGCGKDLLKLVFPIKPAIKDQLIKRRESTFNWKANHLTVSGRHISQFKNLTRTHKRQQHLPNLILLYFLFRKASYSSFTPDTGLGGWGPGSNGRVGKCSVCTWHKTVQTIRRQAIRTLSTQSVPL